MRTYCVTREYTESAHPGSFPSLAPPMGRSQDERTRLSGADAGRLRGLLRSDSYLERDMRRHESSERDSLESAHVARPLPVSCELRTRHGQPGPLPVGVTP